MRSRILQVFAALACCLLPLQSMAAPTNVQLSVWANEAIVATWTWDYQNYLVQQGDIAHYFTSQGWIDYSKALTASGIIDAAIKNRFTISAVATMPPTVQMVSKNIWKAEMPLLVAYKNPQYIKKQPLVVTIWFTETSGDTGVRGLSITSMQSKDNAEPCICKPDSDTPAATAAPSS